MKKAKKKAAQRFEAETLEDVAVTSLLTQVRDTPYDATLKKYGQHGRQVRREAEKLWAYEVKEATTKKGKKAKKGWSQFGQITDNAVGEGEEAKQKGKQVLDVLCKYIEGDSSQTRESFKVLKRKLLERMAA